MLGPEPATVDQQQMIRDILVNAVAAMQKKSGEREGQAMSISPGDAIGLMSPVLRLDRVDRVRPKTLNARGGEVEMAAREDQEKLIENTPSESSGSEDKSVMGEQNDEKVDAGAGAELVEATKDLEKSKTPEPEFAEKLNGSEKADEETLNTEIEESSEKEEASENSEETKSPSPEDDEEKVSIQAEDEPEAADVPNPAKDETVEKSGSFSQKNDNAVIPVTAEPEVPEPKLSQRSSKRSCKRKNGDVDGEEVTSGLANQRAKKSKGVDQVGPRENARVTDSDEPGSRRQRLRNPKATESASAEVENQAAHKKPEKLGSKSRDVVLNVQIDKILNTEMPKSGENSEETKSHALEDDEEKVTIQVEDESDAADIPNSAEDETAGKSKSSSQKNNDALIPMIAEPKVPELKANQRSSKEMYKRKNGDVEDKEEFSGLAYQRGKKFRVDGQVGHSRDAKVSGSLEPRNKRQRLRNPKATESPSAQIEIPTLPEKSRKLKSKSKDVVLNVQIEKTLNSKAPGSSENLEETKSPASDDKGEKVLIEVEDDSETANISNSDDDETAEISRSSSQKDDEAEIPVMAEPKVPRPKINQRSSKRLCKRNSGDVEVLEATSGSANQRGKRSKVADQVKHGEEAKLSSSFERGSRRQRHRNPNVTESPSAKVENQTMPEKSRKLNSKSKDGVVNEQVDLSVTMLKMGQSPDQETNSKSPPHSVESRGRKVGSNNVKVVEDRRPIPLVTEPKASKQTSKRARRRKSRSPETDDVPADVNREVKKTPVLKESKKAARHPRIKDALRAISTPARDETMLRENVTFADKTFDLSAISVLSPKRDDTTLRRSKRSSKPADVEESFRFNRGKKDQFEELMNAKPRGLLPKNQQKENTPSRENSPQPTRSSRVASKRAAGCSVNSQVHVSKRVLLKGKRATSPAEDRAANSPGRPSRQRRKNRK